MSISLEWECDLPTHLVIDAERSPIPYKQLEYNINSGFNYIPESNNVVTPKEKIIVTHDSTSTINMDFSI